MGIQIVDDDERLAYEHDGSRILFRRVDAIALERLRRRHTVQRGRDRDGLPRREVDEAAWRTDLLDAVIVGWEGVGHPVTGESVPCTAQTKAKLPADVVAAILERAMAPEGPTREDLRKNFGGSSSSGSGGPA